MMEVSRSERGAISHFTPVNGPPAGPVIVLGWGWVIQSLVTHRVAHTLWRSFGRHGWLNIPRGGNRPGFTACNENKENCIFVLRKNRPLTWRRNVGTTDMECYCRWWILFTWHVSTLALHDSVWIYAGRQGCQVCTTIANQKYPKYDLKNILIKICLNAWLVFRHKYNNITHKTWLNYASLDIKIFCSKDLF